MIINRVQAVSIPVSDQERAKRFYVEGLGFEVAIDEHQSNGLHWIQLVPPGAQTAIVLSTWHPMAPGSLKGLLLHTADIDSLKARIEAFGMSAPAITDAPWARYFRLEDPDGNLLVIQQRPEG